MNLQLLRIFKAVADEGGIARAADRLHCVQSNVSTRLSQLEEGLDVVLFSRVGRRLVITPKGKELLGYTERLLQLAEEAKAAIRGNGTPTGKFTFGAMETTAAVHLPRVIAEFNLLHPSVELELQTGTANDLIHALAAYKLDAALLPAPLHDPQFEQVELFEEDLVLITGMDHGDIASARDVASDTILVNRAGCAYRSRIDRWFAKASILPRRILQLSTFETIIGCVAAGVGVAMVPREFAEKQVFRGAIRCHDLLDFDSKIRILFAWRKDIPRHSARSAFVDCIRGSEGSKAGRI